jgi:hypothetical protein
MRALLAVLAGTISALAFTQDLGPLEVRNLRGISVPFLRINPRPGILDKGRTDWSLGFEAANDMRFSTQGGRTVREDYEIDRLVLRYRTGLGKGSDLTVEAPFLSRSGGFLDGLIDFWHKYVLRIRGNIRDGQPYGQSYIDLPGHARYGSAAGIGDITMTGSHQMNPRLMGVGAIKLPTGQTGKLLGSGGVDFGGALQWRVPVESRLDLHVQGGYVFQGRATQLPEARKTVLQGALSFVYRANSRDTYVGQWQAEASALKTEVHDSDTSHRMVSLGFRRKMSDDRFLELYMLEDGDWINYRFAEFAHIAPDLTLGIKWIWRR